MMANTALAIYGLVMSYVPTLCMDCWRVHLVSLALAQAGSVECATCGADARIVPGCSFAAAEVEAFEELSSIVAEGHLTPMEAQSYGQELEHALWSGAYNPLMESLSVRMPGLLPHQVAAGKNSGAQRRILSKLKTILEALATARRSSAEYSLVPDASLPRVVRR